MIYQVFLVIGSWAILYGMRTMSDGIKDSRRRLQSVLNFMAGNRVALYLLA